MMAPTRRRTLKGIGTAGLATVGIPMVSRRVAADESTTGVDIEILENLCEEGQARDVNNRTQIVGQQQVPDRNPQAFLWDDGEVIRLGGLGGEYAIALGINFHTQIVGESFTSEPSYHAFLWEDGEVQDLGTLGGQNSSRSCHQ